MNDEKNLNCPDNMPQPIKFNGEKEEAKSKYGAATKEQLSAIKARGKVMVSASAGAGKTTVMIKRLADILEGGADLDEVLCITFTKKAAAQMKDKLRSELISRLEGESGEGRQRIKAQLNKINMADVSTIDSFCARLVRTYCYALGLDSSFEVLADEAEIAELKGRAMESVFDSEYLSANQSFLNLVGALRKKRSDRALKDMASAAYDELRISPDYTEILDNCQNNTFTEEGFERVCARLKEQIDLKLDVLISALEDFYEYFTDKTGGKEGYLALLDDIKANICVYKNGKNLFGAPRQLTTLRKPVGKGEFDAEFSAFVTSIKNRFKKLTEAIGEEEEERAAFIQSGSVAFAFCDLVKKFDDAYGELKKGEGKLDYGDLEQYALKLLCGEDGDVKKSVNGKYKYVFVDEYQDVNPIQDRIITLVSDGDLFCVGDVKQAIYGFRGSRPDFFMQKCKNVGSGGEYIILPDNFRSAGGVVNFVNEVFSRVICPPVSPVNYAEGHAMRGRRYPDEFCGKAEFVLFDGGVKEKLEPDGVYSVNGQRAVAAQISPEASAVRRLVEEALKSTYYDPDLKKEVPVKEGDICVLTRKRSNASAREIVRALSASHPVVASAEVNVCERAEIIRLLNVLSYIDNSEQDIPLTAALLSPLGGLNEEELAKIRLYGGDRVTFRECARAYQSGVKDDLSKKLGVFFEKVKGLKKLSYCVGAAKLTDELERSCGFVGEFASEAGQTYLKTFKREAFGPSGELSLSAFLAKIKRGGNKVLAPASVASDCINVMTMHAAKGLEFPVVIVADIAASFKGREGADMPLDEEFGFAPRYYAPNRSYRDTVLRRLCRMRTAGEELANEINLLYVACTRAKYKLYVLTSKLPKYSVAEAAFAGDYAHLIDFSRFDVRSLSLADTDAKNEEKSRNVSVDSAALQSIRSAAAFKYKFEEGIDLPVKSSASRLISETDSENSAVHLFDEEEEKGAVTNPQTGLAYHRYLQLADLSVRDSAGVTAQIERFFGDGLLTEEYKNLLDADSLVKILSMPVFKRAEHGELFREREFLCRLPSSSYRDLQGGMYKNLSIGEDDGNGVIVQGAIDLLCVKREGGRAVAADIIDYKYSAHSKEYLKAKYAPQLGLYKSVVCKIYGLDEEAVSLTIVNICRCFEVKLD